MAWQTRCQCIDTVSVPVHYHIVRQVMYLNRISCNFQLKKCVSVLTLRDQRVKGQAGNCGTSNMDSEDRKSLPHSQYNYSLEKFRNASKKNTLWKTIYLQFTWLLSYFRQALPRAKTTRVSWALPRADSELSYWRILTYLDPSSLIGCLVYI